MPFSDPLAYSCLTTFGARQSMSKILPTSDSQVCPEPRRLWCLVGHFSVQESFWIVYLDQSFVLNFPEPITDIAQE